MTKVSIMANQLDTSFAALSDPTRRAVVERLVNGPATVSELHDPHKIALPTFLRHLKVLESGGLIRSTKIGRVRTCHIEPAPLIDLQNWLQMQRGLWERRLDRLDRLVAATKRNTQ